MKIPKKITIIGREYTVTQDYIRADRENILGKIYYNQGEILLNNSKSISKEEKNIAFLHEIIHGIFHALDYDQEEKKIIQLSETLYQIMKQIKV